MQSRQCPYVMVEAKCGVMNCRPSDCITLTRLAEFPGDCTLSGRDKKGEDYACSFFVMGETVEKYTRKTSSICRDCSYWTPKK